jgi:hypothetical protein
MIAQTIRHATALGLHLKVVPGVFSAEEATKRARIWWSLFRIEVMLSEMTGRPKCVQEMDVTISVSSLFTEDDVDDSPTIEAATTDMNTRKIWEGFLANGSRIGEKLTGGMIPWAKLAPMGLSISESHFKAALELSSISSKIGSSLYLSPADLTWADVQSTVRELEQDLARYEASLRSELSIDGIGETRNDPRSNLELQIGLSSVRMILYRPFLCEIRIEDESPESTRYNTLCARAGVNAAIRLTQVMPDDPVAEQVLMVLPWWSLLRHVSQAAAVLCLELCLNAQHMQNETTDVMLALRKALNYLWVLAPTSKSAYRAWNIYRPLVGIIAQRYKKGLLSELPLEAARPEPWTDQDESMMRSSFS